MLPKTITIDPAGRITLPQPILEALGVSASHEAEVVIELTEKGVMLKPKEPVAPLTELIAAMNLPVASWEQMKQEIEAGRVK